MIDRQPTLPGRVKITRSDGSTEYVTVERADEPTQAGTPLNRATLFDSAAETRYGVDTPSGAFKKLTNVINVTIPLSGWSSSTTNGWYTNRVTVSGMKAAYEPYADVVYTSAALAADEDTAWSCIKEIETVDGAIIARALDKPDRNINVRLVGV